MVLLFSPSFLLVSQRARSGLLAIERGQGRELPACLCAFACLRVRVRACFLHTACHQTLCNIQFATSTSDLHMHMVARLNTPHTRKRSCSWCSAPARPTKLLARSSLARPQTTYTCMWWLGLTPRTLENVPVYCVRRQLAPPHSLRDPSWHVACGGSA